MPVSLPASSADASPAIVTSSLYAPTNAEFRDLTPGLLQEDSSIVETPADPWANAILDQIVTVYADQLAGNVIGLPPAQSAYEGALSIAAGDLLVGGQRLRANSLATLHLALIDPLDAEHSIPIGRITVERGVLILKSSETLTTKESQEWRLSDAASVLAIQSLLTQARLRDIHLEASFTSGIVGDAQLTIYYASYADAPQISSPVGVTQPAMDISPSPTRTPDIVLGRIIAARINPVIDYLQELPSTITMAYLDHYARSGLLTATETDIQVSGRSIPIDDALNLTVYGIDTANADGIVRLFAAFYTEDATTQFPQEQVYFQGHRMREILYWMVIHAVERGGQLIVGYDELGQIQAVTIIGFKEFVEP